MFKLKISKGEHKLVKERLNMIETPKYDYVVTDDKELVEEDKLNIVFNHSDIPRVSKMMDLIALGEELYLTGSNEFGQKNVESRNFNYFVVDGDDVFGRADTRQVLHRA